MENSVHPVVDPTLEDIRVAIRSLPPYPFRMNGDEMQTVYVDGLKTCKTPGELQVFITEWAPLWSIAFDEPGNVTPECETLVQGTYDPQSVFDAIHVLRQEAETEEAKAEMSRLMTESLPHRIALNVLMPYAMLEMLRVAHHFGVPVNVAWIQAAGLVELF